MTRIVQWLIQSFWDLRMKNSDSTMEYGVITELPKPIELSISTDQLLHPGAHLYALPSIGQRQVTLLKLNKVVITDSRKGKSRNLLVLDDAVFENAREGQPVTVSELTRVH